MELPGGVNYWTSDWMFGESESKIKVIHISEMDKHINDAKQQELKLSISKSAQ